MAGMLSAFIFMIQISEKQKIKLCGIFLMENAKGIKTKEILIKRRY
ncbi:MAG: hypothetical protein KOO65_09455 [Desulfobacterales bacterium]|nr:hypothetical protein [Desulfobacterales bacterium]